MAHMKGKQLYMQLKDASISEKFITAESIEAAFDDLNNRLATMQIDNMQDLDDIALVLKEIICQFGGKRIKSKITFSIDNKFIRNKKSFLLLQSLLSSSKTAKVNIQKVG